MIPGMNPRKMQQMMKQLGIQQQDIPAQEVIIKSEGKEIHVLNPQVSKINMMGQETFQISGDVQERTIDTSPDISDEDIEMVCQQTGCREEDARKALIESHGDIAEAILKLKNE
jgi:nascent polypeptide-associated complex subunit alpha